MRKYSFVFKVCIGLVVAMVLAMLYTAIFSSPEKVKSMDMVHALIWYRIAGFALLVAGWQWICRYMTRKPPYEYDLTEEKQAESLEKRQKDYAYLVTLRWKVALLCVFFEAVLIQQLGFLSW